MPRSSVQMAAHRTYRALVAHCPDNETVQQLTEGLTEGIQHKLQLPHGNAQFISLESFDGKLPLVSKGKQKLLRKFTTDSGIEVKCDYPKKTTIVVTVLGSEGSEVQQYEACIWLLVVLWLGVPGTLSSGPAFKKLREALGPAAGA